MSSKIWVVFLTVLSINTFAQVPISQSPVIGEALAPVADLRKESVTKVLALYSKTERFTGEIQGTSDLKNIFVDFIEAGRYTPEAAIPSNILVLKENQFAQPQFHILGPIQISNVEKTSANKYVVKGSVDPLFRGCPSNRQYLERTLTIEILAEKNGNTSAEKLVPKYSEISEKLMNCSL